MRLIPWVLAHGLATSIALVGCDSGSGFECGRKAAFGDYVYHCDGAGEVCICRTNSCARPNRACPETGYAYVDAPYAHDEGCVLAADLPWSLPPSFEARTCPLPPVGETVDASGSDAPTPTADQELAP